MAKIQKEDREKIIDAMAARFQAGETLTQIGETYDLSRERVRQLLNERGLSRKDGGIHVKGQKTKKDKLKKSEQLKMARFGCTLDQWEYYRSFHEDYKKTPLFLYHQHRHNAKRRGICFDMTINEWWYVWYTSGKWSERGRGGYVMARDCDEGGYTIDNVKIITSSENSTEYYMIHYDEWLDKIMEKKK